MEGDLRPGDSPGVLLFEGNLITGPATNLEIELGGTIVDSEYDQLAVLGDLDLNGTLNVVEINGFVPAPGDTFTIVAVGGNRTGEFSGLSDGQWVPGNDLVISYQGGDGNEIVLTAVLPGDIDGDGALTALDIDPFIISLTSGTYSAAADVNQDGFLNLFDVSAFIEALGGQ